MALFGAPVAREDDAVRACYAALAMHEAFRRHADRIAEERGITIGPARRRWTPARSSIRTTSNDLFREYAALGPAVARRLPPRARRRRRCHPGVARDRAPRRGLRPRSAHRPELDHRRRRAVRGVRADSVPGPARTRFQRIVGTRQLTRFVGREPSFSARRRARSSASRPRPDRGPGRRAGRRQVPARLGAHPLCPHAMAGWCWRAGRSRYGKAASYLPVIDLLKSYCRIEAPRRRAHDP